MLKFVASIAKTKEPLPIIPTASSGASGDESADKYSEMSPLFGF